MRRHQRRRGVSLAWRAHPVVDVHLVVEEQDDELLLVAGQRHPVRHLLHGQLQRPLLAGRDGRQAALAWNRRQRSDYIYAESCLAWAIVKLFDRSARCKVDRLTVMHWHATVYSKAFSQSQSTSCNATVAGERAVTQGMCRLAQYAVRAAGGR